MEFTEFKKCVQAAAKAENVTDYELYYATGESVSVSVFAHEVNNFEASVGGGVSFRCLVNGRMGYASTESLSADEAERIVRAARDNALVIETEEQEFLGEGGKTYAAVEDEKIPLPTAEEQVKLALEAQEKLYAADKLVIDGTSTEVASMKSSVAIVNSRGLDLFSETSNNVVVLSAVVSENGEMNNSFEIKFGDLAKIDLDALAHESAEDAKSKLGADVAPTGAYPVVFAPKAMTSLLSTFSGIFSSESARKGLSRLAESEGKEIASPAVTLIDDPFYPESPAKMPFDAEGTPTSRKNIIEKGRLVTLLYNLKSAAAMGKETTGNASRAGYSSPVGIRPFTMCLAPGELSEDDLLEKAGNGVYIDFLGGLHAGADPISGDFSLQSAGFMIENGKKAGAVKSFTVAGNFYDLLKGIEAVSDTAKYIGYGGITAYASPAVLVTGLTVAGK